MSAVLATVRAVRLRFAVCSRKARRPDASGGLPPRPLAGCRRTQSSIDGDPSFSIHLSLCSTGFHRLRRYYEEIRLLRGRRPVVVASFRSTASHPIAHARWGALRGPMQTSQGKDTGCTAAPGPNTAPISVGFWASRSLARSPDRSGLHRASLTFGAAARLRLLPHTASRRQAGRLATPRPACSCLRLAVATNSLRRGLAPPIQGPCLAHKGGPARSPRLRRLTALTGLATQPSFAASSRCRGLLPCTSHRTGRAGLASGSLDRSVRVATAIALTPVRWC